MQLFWPPALAGFELQSTSDLTQTDWKSLVQIASTNESRWQQGIRIDQPSEFFRLRKPALGPPVHGPVTLTNNDLTALQSAIHGVVTLAFNGTVKLSNALVIAADTTLDATGEVVLDGGNLTRHFIVKPGVTLRLINLTLINGHTVGPEAEENQDGLPGYGGSIYNSGGSVQLIGCKFLNNEVLGGHGGPAVMCNGLSAGGTDGAPGFGGAVYSTNGTVSASDCVFANGKCMGGEGTPNPSGDSVSGGGDALGGAICAHNGRLSLTRVTFTNNVVRGGRMLVGRAHSGIGSGGGSASGGALAVEAVNSSFSNCVFVANQAFGQTAWGQQDGSGNGGAIFHKSGRMEIDMSTFQGNVVTGGTGLGSSQTLPPSYGPARGGAVFHDSDPLVIGNCTFVSNQAIGGRLSTFDPQLTAGLGLGGAIYSFGPLSLTNCTVAQNGVLSGLGVPGFVGFGGGIYGAANVSLVNVTMAGNSVQITDAEPRGSSIAGKATLLNTILACAPSQTNAAGTIIDDGHNLSSDASAAFSAATSRSGIDPLLGGLADNGGPTLTMAPMLNSPAIDAGDDSACPHTDQRGVSRPWISLRHRRG